jgi:hypothetical protein
MVYTDNASTRLDPEHREELERVKADLGATGIKATDSDALRWLLEDSKKRRQQAAEEGSK